MKRLIVVSLLSILILSACGGAPTSTPALIDTEPPASPLPSATAVPTETPTVVFTPTIVPTITPTFGPTPTETLLPALELPSPAPSDPTFEVWDGVPTYLADSQPGYYFRLTYNSRTWAQTTDSYGQPALGHLAIPYCVIAPNLSGGLMPGLQVEHDMRKIGEITYEVNVVLQQGVRKLVTYQASDGVIFTGFRVDFEDQPDQCIADAETVLGTLTSVAQDRATPVP